MYVFASVEFALKQKSGKTSWAFKRLLELAIQEKWIRDSGFRNVRFSDGQPEERGSTSDNSDRQDVQEYCKILLDSLPSLRNELAHGSNMLHPSGLTTLVICADLINQLFERPKGGK